jgi:predicted house-cleaning noncanonical NTP pyrophosphatase (MazG superfamily)
MNRQLRRLQERKGVESKPLQVLRGLSNLEGLSNLSVQIGEFLEASKKMESLADGIENVEDVLTKLDELKSMLEAIGKNQSTHKEVLTGLLEFLMSEYPPISSGSDLDRLYGILKADDI